MSLLRMPKFQRIGSSWESVMDFFSGRSRRRASSGRKNRRLVIDSLEERMLLTIAANMTSDQLVNQTTGSQTTADLSTYNMSTGINPGTQAVASDNNGDFVVVWTRTDSVADPDHPGNFVQDQNIYARYYTDEVQRIVLPSSAAKFSLTYGGNAIEKISFSLTIPVGGTQEDPIQGTFKLGCDLNGNGTLQANEITNSITFNEPTSSSGYASVANLLQSKLQALGGVMADVTVQALNSHDYQVNFGPDSQGQPMAPIAVVNPAWTSGFLPAATVSYVRQPINIGIVNGKTWIPISTTDPSQTATAIESAFASAPQYYSARRVTI